MKYKILYATKIWLTGVLLTPLLIALIDTLFDDGQLATFQVVGLMIGYGTVFSIPGWLTLMFLAFIVLDIKKKKWMIRLIIQLIVVFITYLVYKYVPHPFLNENKLILIYLIPLSIAVWIYKIEGKEKFDN